MTKIRVLSAALALVAAAGLAGCATETQPPPRAEVFFDSAFKPASVHIDAQEAMALSPAMKRFAETEMASEIRNKGLRDGLIDALYTKGRLQLDYDAEATRTAAEAFDVRRGNCMSLVLMTAAFARHFNMPVRFNSVYLEESWTRANNIFFVAGHVNISLARPLTSQTRTIFGDPELLTIDFLPPEQVRGHRGRVIDESTILAMYLNNRAAEALTVGQVDDAYWWAREAIRTDSRWLSAYNTLAVLYRRKGLMDRAEATLRLVLDREPLNTQAMSNLILVLSDTGRRQEAERYANQLAQIQPIPPYKFFDEGLAAMRSGEYATARQLFRKEVQRAAYVPEFHFWLGLANYGMGDVSGARGEIAKALENSATVKDREMYGAKLAWLNEMREQQLQQRQQRVPIRGPAGS
ncbi:tetratricopeptide (TPR) repeat protein [Pelomonas saccharophila]|uniref:Tetratricopeptide (TPR) repeat protein n=1 Tax=Roseateles saccharophilus TaxID=304 RepID=A0ABU1YFP1_ROSSA|nr:tetratricopeptide repeat protein [Roseateles saccharophilus]MDR7267664.1 tetratricopeptide (TPR) repeat protein [Roseateles saccharophilus]